MFSLHHYEKRRRIKGKPLKRRKGKNVKGKRRGKHV